MGHIGASRKKIKVKERKLFMLPKRRAFVLEIGAPMNPVLDSRRAFANESYKEARCPHFPWEPNGP